MIDNPQVQITVEHMKRQIRHAFSQELLGLDADFETAIDRAVKDFNFQEEIYKLAKQELANIATELVRKVVTESLNYSLSWEAQEQLKALLLKTVAKAINKEIKNEE